MNFKSTALFAAKESGKILLRHFNKKSIAKEKSNKSLVSKADLEANEIIIKIIKKNFPRHSILSEETGFEDKKSDYKWVIDPLDGTHNFLRGIELFGISIALEYKNKVVLGVIHFPIFGFTAIAEKGKGAFLDGKRLSVSNRGKLDHSLMIFELPYASRKEQIGFLEKFIHKTIDLRNFGSAVWELLLVACGKCDGIIILSTHEWDIAAGFLIVEEAGGCITDLHGEKWNPQEEKFVASNGKLHKQILKSLNNEHSYLKNRKVYK